MDSYINRGARTVASVNKEAQSDLSVHQRNMLAIKKAEMEMYQDYNRIMGRMFRNFYIAISLVIIVGVTIMLCLK